MSTFYNPRETGKPITIKDEGVALHENIDEIDFVGAGVGGAAIGSAITETIPGGGAGTKETPAGTIDGANKVFTITSANLSFLFLNGILQEEDVKFTISGTTITYTKAPRTGMKHLAYIA